MESFFVLMIYKVQCNVFAYHVMVSYIHLKLIFNPFFQMHTNKKIYIAEEVAAILMASDNDEEVFAVGAAEEISEMKK